MRTELSVEAGEMAQWLRDHTALPEDPRSAPSTYIRSLTTACNISSRRITALFWIL